MTDLSKAPSYRNKMCWVCDCRESSDERIRSGEITAIAPLGSCRFCGRSYIQANACGAITSGGLDGLPLQETRCLEGADHRGPHWRSVEAIECSCEYFCPGGTDHLKEAA